MSNSSVSSNMGNTVGSMAANGRPIDLMGNLSACSATPFATTTDPITVACKRLPPSFIKKGLHTHQLLSVAYGRDFI